MPNPTRFINLPAAVGTILIRKLLDTYGGASLSNVSNLVLPTGFRALEKLVREFMRFNGLNVYIFGVAATSIIYYLRKSKLIRVISRRSRDAIAYGVTSSTSRRPRLEIKPSIRMLFKRDDKIFSYLKRGSFPRSRRSNCAIASSTQFTPDRVTNFSAPPIMEPRVIISRDSFSCGAESVPPLVSPTQSICSSAVGLDDDRFDFKSLNITKPQPKSHNTHTIPNRTHLQDVHGNIYDSRSLPEAICKDLREQEPTHLEHQRYNQYNTQVPPMTATTEESFKSGNYCDGDFSRLMDETEMDVYTPSVIREILPSEIDMADFNIPSNLSIRGLKVKGRPRLHKQSPKNKEKPPREKKKRGPKPRKRRGSTTRSQDDNRKNKSKSRVRGQGLRVSPKVAVPKRAS